MSLLRLLAVALGCSSLTAIFTGPALAARPKPLGLRPVSGSSVARLFAAADDAVAWTDDLGRVTVRYDDGRRLRPAAPADCGTQRAPWGETFGGFVAAGGGRLLFDCGIDAERRFRFAVTTLAGTRPVKLALALPRGDPSPVSVRIGGTWMVQWFNDYHTMIRRYVNWRTGDTVEDSGDELGIGDEGRTYETLDGPEPRANVCPPFEPPVGEAAAFAILAADARYVVESRANGAALLVHRCARPGSILAVPPVTSVYRRELRVALAGGWLAYSRFLKGSDQQPLALVRLADRRHVMVAPPPGVSRGFVLTRRRIYVESAADARAISPKRLYSAALPRAKSDPRR